MNTKETILEQIVNEQIEFIDLRFTDIRGIWHSFSLSSDHVTKENWVDGFTFDGSSFESWVDTQKSDLVLIPDPCTAMLDPMQKTPTVCLICSIQDTTKATFARDPRSTASRAEEYLKSFNIFNGIHIGPELEFFMFDDVKFESAYNKGFFEVDDVEGHYNSGREYPNGNLGNRSNLGYGLHDLEPADRSRYIREEIAVQLRKAGVPVTKHHHEGAASQHEIGIVHAGLVKSADRIQMAKYVAKNVAFRHGKSLTFMPKPVSLGTGSGMHLNISLIQDGISVFHGKNYANLSKEALFFVGGIFKHGKALNAICNASTNSYKRLSSLSAGGLSFTYGAMNRASAVRIPHISNKDDSRVEIRFPDASANPYLAFAAIVMAGLDGIEHSIDPGKPQESNTAMPMNQAQIGGNAGSMACSLSESLTCLNEDRSFLLRGGVFTNAQINAYLLSKNPDIQAANMAPTPIEFQNYYLC